MMRYVLDKTFSAFYLYQFLVAIGNNTQAVFPAWLYPSMCRRLFTLYVETFRDPYLVELTKFPWYIPFCLVEFTMGLPFFCVATYAYWEGAERCPWIRIPVIIYCTHAVTACTCVMFNTMMLPDFASHTSASAPRDLRERLNLTIFYLGMAVPPLLNLLDAVFSSAY